MRVQHETCSTICGTPVQAILDQKNLTGLAGGVREGPNIAKYGPRFWLLSPLEAPKWVQDPGNGLKSIRGSWGDHLGSISGVLDPFRGLLRAQKPKMRPIFGNIWTFPDPPCQPGQIFLVQNGLYRCPTYSTTCFMSNSHLWGVFLAL